MNEKPELRPRPTAWRVQSLADDWGLSTKTIYTLISEGRLRTVRAGRHHLIPDEVVQEFLAGNARSAA